MSLWGRCWYTPHLQLEDWAQAGRWRCWAEVTQAGTMTRECGVGGSSMLPKPTGEIGPRLPSPLH